MSCPHDDVDMVNDGKVCRTCGVRWTGSVFHDTLAVLILECCRREWHVAFIHSTVRIHDLEELWTSRTDDMHPRHGGPWYRLTELDLPLATLSLGRKAFVEVLVASHGEVMPNASDLPKILDILDDKPKMVVVHHDVAAFYAVKLVGYQDEDSTFDLLMMGHPGIGTETPEQLATRFGRNTAVLPSGDLSMPKDLLDELEAAYGPVSHDGTGMNRRSMHMDAVCRMHHCHLIPYGQEIQCGLDVCHHPTLGLVVDLDHKFWRCSSTESSCGPASWGLDPVEEP